MAMMVRSLSLATGLLGGLLLFGSGVYASAPLASLAAERVSLTPARRAWMASPQNTGDRPPIRRGAIVGASLGLAGAAAAVAAVLVVTSPPDTAPFGSGSGNLPSFGGVAPGPGSRSSPAPTSAATPTAQPSVSPPVSPAPVSPSATPHPSPSATAARATPATP